MNPSSLRVSHLSDPRQVAGQVNIVLKKTDALQLSADQLTLEVDRPISVTGNVVSTADFAGVNVDVSGVYKIATVQVVGPRQTGWAADTGTAQKTSSATYTAPTISNPPTQAEVQAIANALQNASRGQKAIKDALITHGLIGT